MRLHRVALRGEVGREPAQVLEARDEAGLRVLDASHALDAQLVAFQEQANTRIEGMGRIQNAETDLLARVEELQALVAEMQSQRDQCVAHEERLAALLAVERDHSLA